MENKRIKLTAFSKLFKRIINNVNENNTKSQQTKVSKSYSNVLNKKKNFININITHINK